MAEGDIECIMCQGMAKLVYTDKGGIRHFKCECGVWLKKDPIIKR